MGELGALFLMDEGVFDGFGEMLGPFKRLFDGELAVVVGVGGGGVEGAENGAAELGVGSGLAGERRGLRLGL